MPKKKEKTIESERKEMGNDKKVFDTKKWRGAEEEETEREEQDMERGGGFGKGMDQEWGESTDGAAEC